MAAFTLGAFGLLIYQLYALQLRDAELYRTEAVTQQLQDTDAARRRAATIYSANGKLLAKSSTVWNIVADPASIREERRVGGPSCAPAAENISPQLLGGGHHCG